MSVFFAAPALPLHSAGKYVAGAYIVFVTLILIYVVIMAKRLRTTERELERLRREALDARTVDEPEREQVGAGRLTRPPAVASPDGERGPA